MNKRMVLRKVLLVEIVLFVGYYVFGAHGLQAIKCIKRENNTLEGTIVVLNTEIGTLEHDIEQWDTHIFYKEKIAREQLQLVKEGEEVYYVG